MCLSHVRFLRSGCILRQPQICLYSLHRWCVSLHPSLIPISICNYCGGHRSHSLVQRGLIAISTLTLLSLLNRALLLIADLRSTEVHAGYVIQTMSTLSSLTHYGVALFMYRGYKEHSLTVYRLSSHARSRYEVGVSEFYLHTEMPFRGRSPRHQDRNRRARWYRTSSDPRTNSMALLGFRPACSPPLTLADRQYAYCLRRPLQLLAPARQLTR